MKSLIIYYYYNIKTYFVGWYYKVSKKETDDEFIYEDD